MGFSRQEYWSGLPCPSPGGSSWPRDQTGISHIAGGFFTIWATREVPRYIWYSFKKHACLLKHANNWDKFTTAHTQIPLDSWLRETNQTFNNRAGRVWGQEEKGTTEDEMAGWHHWLDGHESGWTPGVGDGQGGLSCCDSWGRKESDTTERLNWTEQLRNHHTG